MSAESVRLAAMAVLMALTFAAIVVAAATQSARARGEWTGPVK